MNNRSAAREIIILAIPQLPKDPSKLATVDVEKIILSFCRSLSDYAKKNINSVTAELVKMEKFLSDKEVEHPDNEKHTSQIQPVLIPDTNVLKNQISKLELAAVELFNALDVPELIAHSNQENTLEYAQKLFSNYVENKEKIDKIIEDAALKRKQAKKWKIERMVRLDRDILRVSTVELLCFEDVPIEVACDEAVKVAEKYGGDDSKRFVNGVLRDIVEITRGKQKGQMSEV